MTIQTTHVGSLPRPAAMHTQLLKKETVTPADMERYVHEIIERQMQTGLTFINNGEVSRPDYVTATVGRIAGFSGTCIAPIAKDLEELPEYSRRFSGRNGLITLNPKAPVRLPACTQPLSYVGEATLREELDMMVDCFQTLQREHPRKDNRLFFTAPSPGTVALFMENQHYPDDAAYLDALGEVLQKEYELIAGYDGLLLQIDCPDLAMGRHTRFRHLTTEDFLKRLDAHVDVLNSTLANIPGDRCRVHICWGNYAGTHHCDIGLDAIFDRVMRVAPRYISLESSNHRHAHEWEVFETHRLPDDKVLLPGVIDTNSNTVEHPRLVAQRIRNFTRFIGADRVIASTDCGFASTASAASVSGEVAWLKLKALVEGAEIAAGW